MKIKKYLNKMADYLNVEKRKCANHKACLKKVVKALKERESSLMREVAKEKDVKKCKELNEEIVIVHKQRKKGVKALRELNNS